jgi:hypothetical protein
MVKFQSAKRACVVGREKAVAITALFAHKKGAMTWLHP